MPGIRATVNLLYQQYFDQKYFKGMTKFEMQTNETHHWDHVPQTQVRFEIFFP